MMTMSDMAFSSHGASQTKSGSPALVCHGLPAFDEGGLEAIRLAFQHATPCALRQAWLTQEERDFAPTVVRIGWRGSCFLLFAELSDTDIQSRAMEHNQRLWELGDTFELFLQADQGQPYVEFHVSPNNNRLQMRFAGRDAAERVRIGGSLEEVIIKVGAFRSMTWVRPELKKWFVYAEIPAGSVCAQAKPLAGCQWRFSFNRYDYTRGRSEPVISSTSPHAEPDFHRSQEWGIIQFQNQNTKL